MVRKISLNIPHLILFTVGRIAMAPYIKLQINYSFLADKSTSLRKLLYYLNIATRNNFQAYKEIDP